MGERYFGEILEVLDKAFPNSLEYNDLLDKGFSNDLIRGIISSNLVFFNQANRLPNQAESKLITINDKGFFLLNQIRLKKATDKLDKSIEQFSEDSKKSSNLMADLTLIILLFTAFQATSDLSSVNIAQWVILVAMLFVVIKLFKDSKKKINNVYK